MTGTPREIMNGWMRMDPFPFVLRRIVELNFSGLLEFVLDSHCKRFYFANGNVVTVESSSVDEQLIELIHRGGVLSDDALDSLDSIVQQNGWNSPEALEIIDTTTQKWWMKILIRETMMTVMDWSESQFCLIENEPLPPELPQVEMETIKLLSGIVQRIRDIELLVDVLGGFDRILKVDPEALRGPAIKSLTAQDGFFLSRIDGIVNLKQVLALGGSQKIEMARSIFMMCVNGFLKPEPGSEAKLKAMFMESHGLEPELMSPEIPQEGPAESIQEPVEETEEEPHSGLEEIVLTTDEMKELRQMAGKMGSEFFDLAKALSLDMNQKPEDVGFDAQITYLRGDTFVHERSGGLDIDNLTKTSSSDHVDREDDGEDSRIAFIIDGKAVDGESDLFGSGLSRDIFELEDEDQQWELWMISEEELQKDFEKDWTSTWADWVENTGELSSLKRMVEQMENKLKNTTDEKLRESILIELRKHNVDIQELIKRKKREIFSIHRRMQLMTFYELLRIERNASEDLINQAFDKWESQLSPDDEFIREFSTMAPQINEIIDLINNAYEVLTDPEKRQRYDALLIEKELASEEVLKKKETLAEEHLISARTAKRRGDNMLAMRFVRGSLSLDPNKAVYFREMAQLLAQNKNWRREALRFYHRAYHLDPSNQETLLDIAELAQDLSLRGFAIRVLKQAVSINPSNDKAKRLLNKLQMNI